MKSGGPWNLRGLHPQAREAAREAARRSGMSVGEWLNTVIQPADEDDDEWWAAFEREADNQRPQRQREDERGLDRYRRPNRRGRGRNPEEQWRQNLRYDDQEDRYREDNWHRRSDRGEEEIRVRRASGPHREDRRRPGGPYYEEQRGERVAPRGRASERSDEGSSPPTLQKNHDAFVDQAVAAITARQRALDADAGSPPAASHRPTDDDQAANTAAHRLAPDADVAAEIAARQRALEGGAVETSFSDRQPLPLSSRPQRSVDASMPALDLGGLEQQLRQITTRIEALRPGKELETAIGGLRADLAEIGRSLMDALPRRALESLEIEIKALGQRIDHSRQTGVGTATLADLERALADVREALHKLTPAESLVGFEEVVNELAKKVDTIVAKDDPATMQQLEAAIGALRGIVTHVASNDALTKVAEEVRALAAKIDGLANSAVSGPDLSVIENRINTLAGALKASTEAGYAVPRELEKLLAGLIEKLEWVQLTHTDHTAFAHLEDRIAALVKRLDVPDSRLSLLEGVERGLADLLFHIDQLRGANSGGDGPAKKPSGVNAIEQEVARTQESLEAVQGTVEHVVGRLAMLESDMRVDRARPALGDPAADAREPAPPVSLPEPPPAPVAAVSSAAPETAEETVVQSGLPRSALARAPIDPNLPPDHPLEPGSTSGRSRNAPSAAVRIAASEATIGSKPPVIPDPGGGKPDFIAAARRAAQAAALASPQEKSGADVVAVSPKRGKKLAERLRTVMVAAAVVIIVLGGFHIVSRLIEDGGSAAPPQVQTPSARVESPRVQTESPPVQAQSPRVDVKPLQLQTESAPLPIQPPQVEGEPHVQMENPSAPATTLPSANPANPPATVPVPGVDSGPGPGAALQPSRTPGGSASGAGPAKPPEANAVGGPSTTLAGKPAGIATGPGMWPAPEITGSLPGASVTTIPPTAVSTQGTGDKLPSAIGRPALRAAALAGDASAAYEVAVRLVEGRGVPPNSEEAAHWFERAAKKGLALAQFRLGGLYEKGLGVKKNLAVARDLYRAAADKGNGKAMHNLAVLYAEGIDGAADYRNAAHWFRKAADRGVTDSQYNLAVLYARGVGVEQSLTESYKWFFLAAKEGDKDAAQKRDEVAKQLDERALSAARIEVESWTPLPQPLDAITVKGGWDSPTNEMPPARSKFPPRAKASASDAAKAE
jgi:localization factor PodJL